MPTKLDKEIKTNDDLAKILGIDLKHLLSVAKEKNKHYKSWEKIIKGKRRKYTSADFVLKPIQESIDKNILNALAFPKEIQGGILGRSRSTNAFPHLKGANLDHFDLLGFYENTTPKKVCVALRSIGIWETPAKLLTLLTTTTCLPTGFTTSPKIAGIVLLKLNRRLIGFLKKFGIEHTLWIDDITLSGSYPLKKLHGTIESYVEDEGYKLNKEKSDKNKIVYKSQLQKVTGIVTSGSELSAEKEKVSQVEKAIYVCENFGIEKYLETNEPKLSIENLKSAMSGRLGNLLSINRFKYQKYQDAWKAILVKEPLRGEMKL